MIPPTSIDGTDITGATIDGTDVQEITVDGDVVFSAAPPVPIPTNQLQIWFSASQETSANNTTINTLPDFSGNNRNATFAHEDKAVYKTSGGKMNGAAYYEFDGGYDTSYIPPDTNGFSLFLVYNNSSDPPIDQYDVQFDFGGGAFADHLPFRGGDFYISLGSSSRWLSGVSGLDSDNVHLLYIYGDGSSLVAEQYDGNTSNTLGTQSSSFYTFNRSVIIGTNSAFQDYLNGEVYEVLFYDKYLTSAEETQIGNFLNPLYGLNF